MPKVKSSLFILFFPTVLLLTSTMASITMSKLFLSVPSTLSTTNCNCPVLSFSAKPLRLYLSPTPSYALSFKVSPSLVALVARTADWAGSELGVDAEPGLSEWEGGEVVEGEESEGDVVVEGEEDGFIEPPEGAKLFVGNLSYDMDSETLAKLLEPAGIVEISEVIYNRNTDQSRGFGFVTMRTVEEAEKAIEMFNRYDCNGRLLTVNKASSQGSQPQRAEREFAPSFRVYVGNLPWQVDNARLEELFSEHGKVLNARVIFDRESGRSRGFGFVTMATKTDQDEAVAGLDGQSLEGRVIRVNVAEERPRNGSFLSNASRGFPHLFVRYY